MYYVYCIWSTAQDILNTSSKWLKINQLTVFAWLKGLPGYFLSLSFTEKERSSPGFIHFLTLVMWIISSCHSLFQYFKKINCSFCQSLYSHDFVWTYLLSPLFLLVFYISTLDSHYKYMITVRYIICKLLLWHSFPLVIHFPQ